MIRILFHWLAIVAGVFVASHIVPGIKYDNWTALSIAAAVLGLLNLILRPILIFFTLPAVILTLGLFILVINAFLIYLTGRWVEGFHADGIWSLFFGSIIVSAITYLFGAITPSKKQED